MEMDALSKEFLSVRLGAMLEKKAQMNQQYQLYNREEEGHFDILLKTLSAEQEELVENYREAVIDREIQELYFAYMFGLKDGIRVNDLIGDNK